MNIRFAHRYLVAGAAFLLATCFGCGTGEYETRMKKLSVELVKEAAFSELRQVDTLPGTSATIQLPKQFQATPLPEGTEPQRLNPPLPEDSAFVASLKCTYEGAMEAADGEGGKMSFYCHLIECDLVSFAGKTPADELAQLLKDSFPGTISGPEAVECQTPQGVLSTWQKVRATGMQKFRYVDSQGQATLRDAEGVLEFYCREKGNLLIVILWRVPTYLIGPEFADLDEWGKKVAGSVTTQ